jgi:hypothetical protein
VVGTDEITETPSFEVEDGAYAVVLDEAIVPYSGSAVTVSAKNSKGTELFIGTANGVDADSYLDGVAQEQISDVTFPKETVHRFLPGESKPEAAIGDRDWWISQDTGKSVSKTFDLDAQPQVLVIAPANSDDSLEGTTVDLNMRVNGVIGLSLLGIALGIILAGFSVFFFMRWWGSRIRPPKKDVDPRPDDGSDGGLRAGIDRRLLSRRAGRRVPTISPGRRLSRSRRFSRGRPHRHRLGDGICGGAGRCARSRLRAWAPGSSSAGVRACRSPNPAIRTSPRTNAPLCGRGRPGSS